jgi:hypothetical protein
MFFIGFESGLAHEMRAQIAKAITLPARETLYKKAFPLQILLSSSLRTSLHTTQNLQLKQNFSTKFIKMSDSMYVPSPLSGFAITVPPY